MLNDRSEQIRTVDESTHTAASNSFKGSVAEVAVKAHSLRILSWLSAWSGVGRLAGSVRRQEPAAGPEPQQTSRRGEHQLGEGRAGRSHMYNENSSREAAGGPDRGGE